LSKKILCCVFLFVFFWANNSLSDEWYGDWEGDLIGSLELGYDRSTGNTDSEDTLIKLYLKYTEGDWWTDFKTEVQHRTDDDVVNDNIVTVDWQTNYNYNATDYWFANLNSLHDEFASIDRQTSLTGGWGRHMIKTEVTVLDLEFGAGFRVSRESVTEDTTNEAVLTSRGKWTYQINENTRVGEEFWVEASKDNTYTVSETFIRVKMAESLGLKFSYLYKNNSTVPDHTKRSDTETRLTVEYEF